jgi:adenosine deaminase
MNNLDKFIKLMPKIELHVHLEGSLQLDTVLKLAKKNRVLLPYKTIDELKEWYTFSNFPNFIETYKKVSECIRTLEDIEILAKDTLIQQKKQNILYSEFIYTPYTHLTQKGLEIEDQISALSAAKSWANEELGISCNYILDFDRGILEKEAFITLNSILDTKCDCIAGFGIGGYEPNGLAKMYKNCFELANSKNISVIPHAGETYGPENIWQTLEFAKPKRIGHGVRSSEDPKLIKILKSKGIILEICPTSNICLNIYPTLSKHVLPKLVKEGIKVTINSDDPAMFNTTLTNEYLKIANEFNFTANDFYFFNQNAIEGTMLSTEKKTKLMNHFNKEWNNALETSKLKTNKENHNDSAANCCYGAAF